MRPIHLLRRDIPELVHFRIVSFLKRALNMLRPADLRIPRFRDRTRPPGGGDRTPALKPGRGQHCLGDFVHPGCGVRESMLSWYRRLPARIESAAYFCDSSSRFRYLRPHAGQMERLGKLIWKLPIRRCRPMTQTSSALSRMEFRGRRQSRRGMQNLPALGGNCRRVLQHCATS